MNEPIAVTGIMLRRYGNYAIVEAEIDGKWVMVVSEPLDSNFSHIVEPSGMRLAVERQTNAEAGTVAVQ